jgi:LacI family transcriptional regulator
VPSVVKPPCRQASTLSDVASRAGVDRSTASRVLNGSEGTRVSDATRLRILDAAAALDYRPNFVARGLRTARTQTIALIVPQINSPVFAEIIAGATEAVRARDYTLLIGEQEENVEGDPLYTKLAQANQIDGLIMAPRVRDDALVRRLTDMRIPIVVAHSKVRSIPYCVTIDSFEATKRMIDHLLVLGHRRIAYLARRSEFYNDGRRLAGFRAALRAAGITPDERLIMHTPHTYKDGYAHTLRLLETCTEPPTAIFTVALITAGGVMKALEQARLRVPEDLSVVALYDHEFADVLTPPVTTMHMPRKDVGQIAARVMIDLLEGRRPTPELMLPPGELIRRASTAAPPAKECSPRSVRPTIKLAKPG